MLDIPLNLELGLPGRPFRFAYPECQAIEKKKRSLFERIKPNVTK
jgi:hypothetical protein